MSIPLTSSYDVLPRYRRTSSVGAMPTNASEPTPAVTRRRTVARFRLAHRSSAPASPNCSTSLVSATVEVVNRVLGVEKKPSSSACVASAQPRPTPPMSRGRPKSASRRPTIKGAVLALPCPPGPAGGAGRFVSVMSVPPSGCGRRLAAGPGRGGRPWRVRSELLDAHRMLLKSGSPQHRRLGPTSRSRCDDTPIADGATSPLAVRSASRSNL